MLAVVLALDQQVGKGTNFRNMYKQKTFTGDSSPLQQQATTRERSAIYTDAQCKVHFSKRRKCTLH